MNESELLRTWREEEQEPFAGWDFSYLQGRMNTGQHPWAYHERAGKLMRQSRSVIDLDTGGGERLLSLESSWPERVVATEGYSPNFKLAVERLTPHGAEVLSLQLDEDVPMPFADNEFDLVLNRHSVFNPDEVARILAVGGTFFTEQVHEMWAHDLRDAFNVEVPDEGSNPGNFTSKLTSAGLVIVDVQEWRGELQFTDVGAIVYYLKAIPWMVPNFSVATHKACLFSLQERLEAQGELVFQAREFIIEASKPMG